MSTVTKEYRAGALISLAEIQSFVDQVVRKFCPLKVILFGSYAYGKPNLDSDVDLLVVMRHRLPGLEIASRILLACQGDFPMDVLVRSPSEIRRRLEMGDTFIHEVVSKGVILHEADHAGMG